MILLITFDETSYIISMLVVTRADRIHKDLFVHNDSRPEFRNRLSGQQGNAANCGLLRSRPRLQVSYK